MALTKGHISGSRPKDHWTHRIQSHALFNNHFCVHQFLKYIEIGGLISIIEHLLEFGYDLILNVLVNGQQQESVRYRQSGRFITLKSKIFMSVLESIIEIYKLK